MKKTFKLTHEKTNPARLVEAIKHEVRKYLKRERNKALPYKADFWDFDCRFGKDAEHSEAIHVAEIDQSIDQALADSLESFYLEILAKPAQREKKPFVASEDDEYFEDEDSLDTDYATDFDDLDIDSDLDDDLDDDFGSDFESDHDFDDR